ncbi:hypothetical protein SETIT_3G314100v2 [Setaria italica]|uniref:Uncharacterized protein n=3 Tax=Setaria TaxID=4554 RepID=A0A368QLG8_SETIT|nr:hypothetical protein SETIT_3G314100v2 [Setaria italica]TKW05472.1 hypothetical protein SEVIR_7G178100v2 [Setaria viridis]
MFSVKIQSPFLFLPQLFFVGGNSQNGGSSWLMWDLELLWPLASWILATVQEQSENDMDKQRPEEPETGGQQKITQLAELL